jgi:hypothetical protein
MDTKGALDLRKVFDQAHYMSDKDSGPLASHHTLGPGAFQAASGGHNHRNEERNTKSGDLIAGMVWTVGVNSVSSGAAGRYGWYEVSDHVCRGSIHFTADTAYVAGNHMVSLPFNKRADMQAKAANLMLVGRWWWINAPGTGARPTGFLLHRAGDPVNQVACYLDTTGLQYAVAVTIGDIMNWEFQYPIDKTLKV